MVPSSPGEKDSVEQNPSEDEINNVKPSLDLPQMSGSLMHHQQRPSDVPSQICEGGAMKIAHDADGRVLLRIIQQD
jgi:hypothetical protein